MSPASPDGSTHMSGQMVQGQQAAALNLAQSRRGALMKIVHKGWFAFFAAIYVISLLLLFCATSSPTIADARASDTLLVFAS